MVFGLTGINYGKSHERESVKRVIECHGNKINSNCEVFFYIMIFTIHSEMFLETFLMLFNYSPVVINALTEVFDRTVPSKILFPFPWNPYLKTDGTSLPILFLVKNFEEKEIEFLRFCKKLLSNDEIQLGLRLARIWLYFEFC